MIPGSDLAAQAAQKRQAAYDLNWCNSSEAQLVAILRAHGRHAALSAQELGAMIQRNPRAVRALIAHLRGSDHCQPICSVSAHRDGEPTGFFWPVAAEEAVPTLAQLGSRRAEIQAAIDGIIEGVRRAFGQMDLFGE